MTAAEVDLPTGPLSAGLELLRLFDKGDADGAFGPRHLVVLGWRLWGEVDTERLGDALADAVERHEMLRTEVVRDVDEPFLRVHPAGRPRLDVVDVPAGPVDPADDPDDALRVDAFVNEVEAGTLPADELPHLRAVLGRVDERSWVLVLITHHTASDGWSLHLIVNDVVAAYARRGGHPVAPSGPAGTYREFAVAQRRALGRPETEEARAFWRANLDGARMLDVRADRAVGHDVPGRYAVHRFVIGEETTAATLALARGTRSSPFMVLLAAFVALLHHRTGATDVVTPMITSGRGDPEHQATVGAFFNMVPLRVDLGGAHTLLDLVGRTRTTCLDAYAHELPFGEVAGCAPELNRTYERDDGAVFAFQTLQFGEMADAERVGDLEYTSLRERTLSCPRTSDIPNGVLWGLDLLPSGRIGGTMRYNRLQFDEDTMTSFVDTYERILRRATEDPLRPISAL